MKMLKKIFSAPQVILLLLMLIGTGNSAFSANQPFLPLQGEDDQKEQTTLSLVGEETFVLFDSILPFHKNLLLTKANFGSTGSFDAHILEHTAVSLGYIKRSRYIMPTLTVKEVIFPFHVFL